MSSRLPVEQSTCALAQGDCSARERFDGNLSAPGVGSKYVESPYLNIREAAKYLRVSTSTIRRLIDERELPCPKIRGRIIFKKATLDRYYELQDLAACA